MLRRYLRLNLLRLHSFPQSRGPFPAEPPRLLTFYFLNLPGHMHPQAWPIFDCIRQHQFGRFHQSGDNHLLLLVPATKLPVRKSLHNGREKSYMMLTSSTLLFCLGCVAVSTFLVTVSYEQSVTEPRHLNNFWITLYSVCKQHY